METNTISTLRSDRLRATFLGDVEAHASMALMRTIEPSGLVVCPTPRGAQPQGTRVSAAAPTTSYKATALLPISDVVVFDGFAGCRSWSPPV